MDYGILVELGLVAMGAVLGGWACRKAGIPEVLGYLSAGVLLGPTLHPGGFVDAALITNITYFAVVFRMFILGLDFDPRRLKGRWKPALFAGGLEVGLCTLAGMGLAAALGWPLLHGAILGAALGTTSTNILSKALADRNLSSREDARAAGAATLAEDLIAMVLVAILTLAAGAAPNGAFNPALLWSNALEFLVFASLAFTAGAVLMPLFIDRLSKAHSEELLTLAVIAVLFGFAALSEFLHAGRPVGAFLAGIAVGAARHAPGVSARMLPLRDLLAATAYVGMGLLLKPSYILEMAPYALAAIPLFVALKVASVALGLRLGGTPTLTAARAGGILGQVGTMGIVFACAAILGDPNDPKIQDTVGHLAAFSFVAWLVTVALTGVRLRFLPDAVEKLARAVGARDVASGSKRLPLAADGASARQVRIAITALGCAVALAALAGLATQGADVFLAERLLPFAAALAGFAFALAAAPFVLMVALAFREAAHHGVRRAALRPRRLTRGAHEGARPWSVTGSLLGFALALGLTLGMAAAVAPPAARLWLFAGALAAVAAFAIRRSMLASLAAHYLRLIEARRAPDVRLHDFRGTSPFGYEAEAFLVRAGTRAEWARVGDLKLKERTGANLVALLRPGTQAPIAFTNETPIPPGAELVLGGTMAQLVAAKRYLLEPAPSRVVGHAPADHGHVDADVREAPGARVPG